MINIWPFWITIQLQPMKLKVIQDFNQMHQLVLLLTFSSAVGNINANFKCWTFGPIKNSIVCDSSFHHICHLRYNISVLLHCEELMQSVLMFNCESASAISSLSVTLWQTGNGLFHIHITALSLVLACISCMTFSANDFFFQCNTFWWKRKYLSDYQRNPVFMMYIMRYPVKPALQNIS